MSERIITREDIENLDPSGLFSSIIGVYGIDGAINVLNHYHQHQGEVLDQEYFDDEDEFMQSIREGVQAFTELLRRRLTQ